MVALPMTVTFCQYVDSKNVRSVRNVRYVIMLLMLITVWLEKQADQLFKAGHCFSGIDDGQNSSTLVSEFVKI